MILTLPVFSKRHTCICMWICAHVHISLSIFTWKGIIVSHCSFVQRYIQSHSRDFKQILSQEDCSHEGLWKLNSLSSKCGVTASEWESYRLTPAAKRPCSTCLQLQLQGNPRRSSLFVLKKVMPHSPHSEVCCREEIMPHQLNYDAEASNQKLKSEKLKKSKINKKGTK